MYLTFLSALFRSSPYSHHFHSSPSSSPPLPCPLLLLLLFLLPPISFPPVPFSPLFHKQIFWPVYLKTHPLLPQMNGNINPISSSRLLSFPHVLWLSQRGVLSWGQKGEVASDLWLREGRRERDGDQSGAFKLLIISIKALHDINPVRLLMCLGLWSRRVGWWFRGKG